MFSGDFVCNGNIKVLAEPIRDETPQYDDHSEGEDGKVNSHSLHTGIVLTRALQADLDALEADADAIIHSARCYISGPLESLCELILRVYRVVRQIREMSMLRR